MTARDQQAAAIWQALGLQLINEQFASSVRAVIRLAAMAFDDAEIEAGRPEAVEAWRPWLWGHVKGQLELATQQSGIDPKAQAEWRRAFEAVYRIAGSSDIVPDYGGFL